ncbi:alpha-E domain-containing protein [Leeia sp. TBRC 13508]|uniref:Alpha-E domain-containing protein n=1 Tax=Leeia speluncae TaxID=2884804 RepID=A0ABS8D7H4_9NEIS|nr:alpha-E domain-containing protein [Leeia speluncae]MCB6184156.1 alpha-E domain-containing protein [Leeia speluncae]
MLSRTASHLYWMARYLERAANLSRLLDVCFTLSLLNNKSGQAVIELSAPLVTTGSMPQFLEKYPAVTQAALLDFLVWDQENPVSIMACLKYARENAHAVRGRISADMWETINATWLEAKKLSSQKSIAPKYFFEWVKERIHLFSGVMMATILRNQAHAFILLGNFLERADNTARILMVNAPLLEEGSEVTQDFYHWSSLLQSLSAFQSYHELYTEEITPATVSELLILEKDMPRSLHACVRVMQSTFNQIKGDNGRKAKRRVAELSVKLSHTTIQEIFETGLQTWLDDFVTDTQEVGALIHNAYLDSV